jgi:hypothetical protein
MKLFTESQKRLFVLKFLVVWLKIASRENHLKMIEILSQNK